MKLTAPLRMLAWVGALLGAAACGGGDYVANIGGTVTGLQSGQSVTLENNHDDDSVTVTRNGSFVFGKRLIFGASYDVSVRTQPATQVCQVFNGKGSVNNRSDDVTTIAVQCFAVNN